MKCREKIKGFTLIELMVTVAILAIIVLIAYPNYIEQARKAKRSDGKVALTEVAQVLERCRTNTNTYVNCNPASISAEGHYAITSTTTANTYSLTATAQGGQASDSYCASFMLTHTGAKTATNSDCW